MGKLGLYSLQFRQVIVMRVYVLQTVIFMLLVWESYNCNRDFIMYVQQRENYYLIFYRKFVDFIILVVVIENIFKKQSVFKCQKEISNCCY